MADTECLTWLKKLWNGAVYTKVQVEERKLGDHGVFVYIDRDDPTLNQLTAVDRVPFRLVPFTTSDFREARAELDMLHDRKQQYSSTHWILVIKYRKTLNMYTEAYCKI